MMWRRFLPFLAAAAMAACGHAHAPAPVETQLRCGEPHTRPQAAAMVAVCDNELAQAASAPVAERVRLLYGRGVALTNTRDLQAAIDALSEVVVLDATHARAYRLRGYVYWRQEQLDLAEADTETALRLDPNMAMAYYSRALIYSLREEGLSAAIAEVTRAHEIEPDNPIFLTTRCRMRDAAGQDRALALADCNRALELRPQHADTHDYRGRVLLNAGRTADALADFELALSLDRELASARYGRGLSLLRLGRDAEGRADLAAALALDAEVSSLFVTPRHNF